MSILFFDIDCTLLSHKTFTIPKSTIKALRMAKANGHRSFIASGRGYGATKLYLDPELFDGAVTSSGACGYVDGELVFEQNFSDEEVLEVFRLAEEAGAGLTVQSASQSWMSAIGMRMFKQRSGENDARIKKMGIGLFEGKIIEPICKMDLFFDHTVKPEPLLEKLPASIEQCRTLSETSEFSGCELTPAGLNKAVGALRLAKYLNFDVSDSYAFGDSENDIEIIRECGTGIAMGNAMPEVKKAADYVTADIEEDGIYLAMQHFGLI